MSKPQKSAVVKNFNEIATIRIELEGSNPLIWREFEAQTSMTLEGLHKGIQAVMCWEDYHLWEFSDQVCRYGPPLEKDWGGTPYRTAAKVRLREICSSTETTLGYVYDFGDYWCMRIIISDFRQGEPGTTYPLYIAGEYAAPPEDCGGLPGFYRLVEVLSDPNHPEYEETEEIYGTFDCTVVNKSQIRMKSSRS